MSMAIAVPLFYIPVIQTITLALILVTLLLEIYAFVSCLLQRHDAFVAIGTFSKLAWLGILGGCILFTLLGLSSLFGILSAMLDLVALVFVLVYILDVRPALRDASQGRGSW
jgi:hypothetical protein